MVFDYMFSPMRRLSGFHLSDSAKRWKRWSMTVLIRNRQGWMPFHLLLQFLIGFFRPGVPRICGNPFEVSHAVIVSRYPRLAKFFFEWAGIYDASFERQECHLGSGLRRVAVRG